MSDLLIFDLLGAQVMQQYSQGTRTSILTTLDALPTIGQPVVLCAGKFNPVARLTDKNFIRVTQDDTVRITDNIFSADEIFTSVSSYVKLDCFLSDTNSYVLKFN
jgi:hypothetical protein